MADTGSPSKPFGLFERILAGRYLRAKRQHGGVALISIISFVGIMLAVAVLIITMSVMNGFRETLLSKILGVRGHVFVDMSGRDAAEREALKKAALATSGVVSVTPLIEGQALAVMDGIVSGVIVRGVAAEDLRALKIVADNIRPGGSLDAFGEAPDGSVRIVTGELVLDGAAISGGEITLISPEASATAFGSVPRRKTYPIAANFRVGQPDFDRAFVYMPLSEAQLFFDRGDTVDRFEIQVADPDETMAVMVALRRVMPGDVMISDWKAQNASLVGALIVERNVMRLILMMIVAIAAMNIISGLVMLVKNKGRDIAILRTMGATQGAILRIFFMSGAAVGVFGALAGLTIGTLFCIYIGPIQDLVSWVIQRPIFPPDVYGLDALPARVEWGEVAMVTGWAVLMSLLATLPPALRASRLDPVEALRYE
jgi:lipoprotein-releasing system permease protein